ncbi:MAG: hypothetical protein AMXMBFR4_13950 [Candidatus Hydrogenedentota bacterium]
MIAYLPAALLQIDPKQADRQRAYCTRLEYAKHRGGNCRPEVPQPGTQVRRACLFRVDKQSRSGYKRKNNHPPGHCAYSAGRRV